MKIYELEDGKATVVYKAESPQLYKAIKNELAVAAISGSISEGFLKALSDTKMTPDNAGTITPAIIEWEEHLAIIVPSSKMPDRLKLEAMERIVMGNLNKYAKSFSEIDDNVFLKNLEEGAGESSRSPVSNWKEERIPVERTSVKEKYNVYKLNSYRDIFMFEKEAVVFYYFCHEYYIVTRYLLDDFLDRSNKNVFLGKKILPESLHA